MEDKMIKLIAEITEEPEIEENLDIDLFESALLDSIAYLQLLVELEARFGIAIQPGELERDEMNTPRKILAQAKKRAAHA